MSDTTMLVMIGLDANGKPHAARFGADVAEAAATAADAMSFHLVTVDDGALVELAGSLPEGRLFPTGKALVPFTARATFDRFAALVEGAIEPAPKSETAKPRRPKRSPTAGASGRIEVGAVVLAHSAEDSAWYEAVVTGVSGGGDSVKLRWRDYPGTKPFTVPMAQVVLAPPLD